MKSAELHVLYEEAFLQISFERLEAKQIRYFLLIRRRVHILVPFLIGLRTRHRDCTQKNETAYFHRNFSAHIKVVRKLILEHNVINKKDSKLNLRI